ncbi:MAG TPA: cation transporter [Tissierellia bacterium]|nr:cation transporter [Tissierellia bacterium]
MERLDTAKRLTLVSLATNAFLGIFKVVAGLIGHSSVIVADGIDSLSDMLTTLIAYVGVRISAKEADAGHPYGHERFEAVLGKILALFLFLVAGGVVWRAVEELRFPVVHRPTVIALIAGGVSIVAKFLLSQFTIRQAKQIRSSIYEADGKNYLNDVLSSALALVGAYLATRGWLIFQPLFSLFIAFNIFRVALDLYKQSISDLTDEAADEATVSALRQTILSHNRVKSIDALRTRMHGNRIFVDAEIGVEWSLTLLDAHHIAEEVHDRIEQDFPEVKHIMVHVNPATD